MSSSLLAGLSIHHRRKLGWRWPGVGAANAVAQIIFWLWLGCLFASLIVSLAGREGRDLVTFLGCLGTVLLYALLSALNLVFAQQSEFLRNCRRDFLLADPSAAVEEEVQNTLTPTIRSRPKWHDAVHWFILFLWLALMSAMVGHRIYLNRLTERDQTELAPERTERIKEGRKTIRITPDEKERLTILADIFTWGMPFWIVCFLVARFLLGVKLYGVKSTPPEAKVEPPRNRSP